MKYKVTLNDITYEVMVEKGQAIIVDEYDVSDSIAAAPTADPAPAAAAAAPVTPVGEGDPITAPLPGTVVSVKVAAGQSINSGDLIAIIEAMKMENEVLAPRAGTVTQVVATQGSAVKTGDPLVMLA